ncbi:MAG: hypothetical protein NWE93_04120 [Candidatus Bathyarchaeota archaeon]|nr:hypothetical protein [Candidatus Bathyarchaeota archaeon]
MLKESKNRRLSSYMAVVVAIFVLSPLDDILIAAVCGSALFGFGSAPFYIVMAASSVVSVVFWLRHKRHRRLSIPKSPSIPPRSRLVR